jgi:hypothetical protein
MNTLVNAFIAYCVLYPKYNNIENTFNALGIYGGDDGLTPEVDAESYEKVCRHFGFSIKPAIIKNPECPTFLARVYSPHVWKGSPSSMCNPLTSAFKMNFIFSDLNFEQSCIAKLGQFAYTDPNTPFFGELSKMVAKPEVFDPLNHSWTTFLSLNNKEELYPNEDAEWMANEQARRLTCSLDDWATCCAKIIGLNINQYKSLLDNGFKLPDIANKTPPIIPEPGVVPLKILC